MRMIRQALGGLAAVAAVVLAAGCSSSANSNSPSASGSPASSAAGTATTTPPPTASGRPDSCSVITSAEASAALGGQPVSAPRRGKAFVEGGVACVYYGPSAPASIGPDVPLGDTVRVVLVTGPDAKKWFDDYRGKVNAQPISGLGDEAYYDGYASISVLKGDAYVRIAVGIASNLSAEETLARAALARM